MSTANSQTLESKVQELIDNFKKYLDLYNKRPPFNKQGQKEYHRKTIELRRSAGSATNALNNDDFLWSLYETLRFWGMESIGPHRSPFDKFKETLQSKITLISSFDGFRIDDPHLDIQTVTSELWPLMNSLEINQNRTKLVACSKALHHILPDLVVPIDRTYTGVFLNRSYVQAFQEYQERTLSIAMKNFATIAQAVNPAQYIGKGWNTCMTKIIDNAIVGFLIERRHNIP
jgi:hypothetical protein